MRPLSHRAHRSFVETEGWTKEVGAQGKTRGHFQYSLTLPDGRTLRTRISHGREQLDDPSLITTIYRKQLEVTEQAFWDCVEKKVLPLRQNSETEKPAAAQLDHTLTRNLIRKVGLSEVEVERLSKEQAVARWHEYLSAAARESA